MMSLTKVVWVGIIVDLTLVSNARLGRVNVDLDVIIKSPKAIQAPSDIVPSDKPQICNLKPETGPCRGHSTMFYYENKSKDCKTFIYGGCAGNGNRFGSKEECLKTCQGAGSSDSVPSDEPQICDLKPETGLCQAAFTRFYYDNKSKDCKTFTYGGCGGNGNRFGSKEECLKTCQGAPEQIEDIEKAAGSRKASGSTTHPEFVCSVPPPFC